MKLQKTRLFLFLALFCISKLSAQSLTKIDNLKFKATYLLTYQSNATDANSIDVEEMVLFLGNKTSKFVSLGTHLKDSLSSAVDMGEARSLNIMAQLGDIPKTKIKEIIFKNYPTNKITITEQLLRDYFTYQENKDLFTWEIKKETKKIAGYKCQKAETKFAGRSYTAWFTNKIPISDGPYKFNGLPGLIIQISDIENQYKFELLSFKKIAAGQEITMKNKNYIKTSKKEFDQAKKDFYQNMFKKLEQSGITINLDDPSQKAAVLKKFSKRNNPIELTEE